MDVFRDMPEWGQRLTSIAAVAVVALLATWLMRVVLGRVARRVRGTLPEDSPAGKRARTLASVLGAVGIVLIWMIAVLTALEVGGVPVGPLIATAGIGGVALGFGTQNLVRDCVAGLFILSENQYDVGDAVKVGGVEGTVEAITLRSTVLRGLDGARHVVSNGEIRVSTNTTRRYSRSLVSVPIAYGADVDRALAVVTQAARGLADDPAFADDISGPPTVLGVDKLTDVRIEIACFVETPPGRQAAVGRELRRRLLVALQREGIPLAPGEATPDPAPPGDEEPPTGA